MADNIIWPGIVQSSAQNTPAAIRATDNAGVYTLLVNGLWTPADIADLAYFSQNRVPNCFYNDGSSDQQSGITDSVHFINQLFGATGTIVDGADVILRADGLDPLPGNGVMTLGGDGNSTGIGTGDFTLYSTQFIGAGSLLPILGSGAFQSYIILSGGVNYQDNMANSAGSVGGATDDQWSLVTVRYVSATQTLYLNCTGNGPGDNQTNIGGSGISFDRYLAAPGATYFNDNANNRARTFIGIRRYIAEASIEDARILNWFANPTNDGATL